MSNEEQEVKEVTCPHCKNQVMISMPIRFSPVPHLLEIAEEPVIDGYPLWSGLPGSENITERERGESGNAITVMTDDNDVGSTPTAPTKPCQEMIEHVADAIEKACEDDAYSIAKAAIVAVGIMRIKEYEEVLADHQRLVHELDVALNGAAGAAVQASLCDIVALVKSTVMESGWKPIDTAPKDGTEILLGKDIATVWIVRNGRWVNSTEWFPEQDEDSTGWWAYRNSVSQERLEGVYEPTHWMLLSPEPTST